MVMSKCFKLLIVTPEEKFYTGDVLSLNCKTTEGWRGILANHCAMITGLVPGTTKFKDCEDKEHEVEMASGILKVKENEVIMLCNFAKWVEKTSKE